MVKKPPNNWSAVELHCDKTIKLSKFEKFKIYATDYFTYGIVFIFCCYLPFFFSLPVFLITDFYKVTTIFSDSFYSKFEVILVCIVYGFNCFIFGTYTGYNRLLQKYNIFPERGLDIDEYTEQDIDTLKELKDDFDYFEQQSLFKEEEKLKRKTKEIKKIKGNILKKKHNRKSNYLND